MLIVQDNISDVQGASHSHNSKKSAQSGTIHPKPQPIEDGWNELLEPVRGLLDLSDLLANADANSPCIRKTQKGYEINLDVDAEWNSVPNQPNRYISLQTRPVGFKSVAVMEHPDLGLGILPSWKGRTPVADMLGCRESSRVPGNKAAKGTLTIILWCYFSFGDICAFVGDRNDAAAIQRQCDQKRRMKIRRDVARASAHYIELKPGEWYRVQYSITDVSAQMGIGGLKDYANKVNLRLEDKSSMDDYKSNMLEAYTNPDLLDDYVNYSAGDCVSQLIRDKFVGKVTEEVYQHFDLDPPKEISMTTGSVVEQFFRRYLLKKVMGVSKDDSGLNPTPYLTPMNDIENIVYKEDWILGQASVRAWLESEHQNTTSIYNAAVQGGRCKNASPTESRADGVIGDADIKGCYGNGLMNQHYPIGLPTQFSYGHRQKLPTLRKFLKRWKKELVPGCYQLIVDTTENLSFDQSLVFSKPVESQSFLKQIKNKLDDDDPEIDVNFSLFTRQINNGVINHDVLQVLQSVCNSKEWGELLDKLVVKTGVAYLASNRCDSMEEMKKTVEASPQQITGATTRKGGHIIADTRNRAWYGFPLSDIVGPLLEKRKELKDLKKHHKGTELESEYDAKQQLFKLFINTLYGVLASPYFASGNVVVANNITARARCLAWMMEVACGGVQSITDGSAYDINTVRMWKDKFPGLCAVSTYTRPHLRSDRSLHRNIYTMPLGGSNWSFNRLEDNGDVVLNRGVEEVKGSAEKWGLIDDLYLKHLQVFFAGKNIDILFADDGKGQFGFEHKNIYAQLLTQSQSNYRLKEFNGKTKIKARGHSLKKDHIDLDGEIIDEKTVERLFNEIEQGYVSGYSATFTTQPLKVNAANAGGNSIEARIQKGSDIDTRNIVVLDESEATSNRIEDLGLLAGDTVWKKSRVCPISLSLFMWQNSEQKASWERCNAALKSRLGWGVECFFVRDDGKVDYNKALKVIQEKIDNGDEWIDVVGRLRNKSYIDSLAKNPFKDKNEWRQPKNKKSKATIEREGIEVSIDIPKKLAHEIKRILCLKEFTRKFKQLNDDGVIENMPSQKEIDRYLDTIISKRR